MPFPPCADTCKDDIFLRTLLESKDFPVSSIASLFLRGAEDESRAINCLGFENDHISAQQCIPEKGDPGSRYQIQDIALHAISLSSALRKLSQLRLLISRFPQALDNAYLYRELTIQLQDVGYLLAISGSQDIAYAMVDVSQLLVLSIHILATCQAELSKTMTPDILQSVACLCGALFSSHRGVLEMASAFEDRKLEQAWFRCLLGECDAEYQLIMELRRRPGVWSIAEEVQKASSDIDVSPPVSLSKTDLAMATITLLDAWRTSETILQMEFGDLEHIRRHSDMISKTCLDLAKLCTYDCGREVGWTTSILNLPVGLIRCGHRYRLPEFSHCCRKTFHFSTNL